jgi:2-isopropylmalate synthase
MSDEYELAYLHVSAGTSVAPTATMTLKYHGTQKTEASCGNGPIDATFMVIDRITDIPGELLSHSTESLGSGRDALGEATVTVKFKGVKFSGSCQGTDIVEASAKAYLRCVNRFLKLQEQSEQASH